MPQNLYKKISKSFFLSILIIVGLFLSFLNINYVSAASLSILPASSNISVGNIVSVKISVNTFGKSINNAEGVVQFPTDLLDVLSISKSSSVFSLWVEEPKFSNLDGKVTFNGGVPNPGYVGSNGNVATITFRAKKSGTASVVFLDGAVRENDGMGTDILSTKSSGTISIAPSSNVVVPPPPTASGAPDAPVVTSSSHPEPGKWYSNPNVDLRWKVPSDVTAVSVIAGKSLDATPSVVYDPPIGNKTVSNLADGIWYFNIRFKNKNGWGAIGHFRIQIDTVAPNPFKITFPGGDVAGEPRPVAYFKTTDNLSGVDHYEVKIGEGQYTNVSVQDAIAKRYVMPSQEPGKRSVLVKAVDLAGNETVQTADFTINPINTPEVKDYPSELNEGDLLKISGTSYPLTSVEIVVEDSRGQQTNQTFDVPNDGVFNSVWSKTLSGGPHVFKVRAIDGRGAKSYFSKNFSFTVNKSPFLNFSSFILSWLSIIIIIIILLGVIGLLIFYFIYKGIKIKKKMDDNFNTFETSVHKSLGSLRESVKAEIKILEDTRSKRELTKEEEEIIKHLRVNLTEAENYMEKEMAEISEINNKALK